MITNVWLKQQELLWPPQATALVQKISILYAVWMVQLTTMNAWPLQQERLLLPKVHALNRSHVAMLARELLFCRRAVLPLAERFFESHSFRRRDVVARTAERAGTDRDELPRLV